MSRLIEVCCPSLPAVAKAVEAGADRIELCEQLETGGVTPSLSLISDALKAAGRIPVNVLIRPREGDFVYSPAEVALMAASIRECKNMGVNGVVTGALKSDRSVDAETMRILLAEARPLAVTFHRAFDECDDIRECLEAIIGLGIERLLTSGHCSNAYEGRFVLRELIGQAAGRIVIMPGCGITQANLDEIAGITGAREFHGSRILG